MKRTGLTLLAMAAFAVWLSPVAAHVAKCARRDRFDTWIAPPVLNESATRAVGKVPPRHGRHVIGHQFQA